MDDSQLTEVLILLRLVGGFYFLKKKDLFPSSGLHGDIFCVTI